MAGVTRGFSPSQLAAVKKAPSVSELPFECPQNTGREECPGSRADLSPVAPHVARGEMVRKLRRGRGPGAAAARLRSGRQDPRNASTLSGGQKRKLQLTIDLVGGSKIVLVDEWTSGVDPQKSPPA
ncbi:hypothetical protein DFH08DRAFT_797159 [Mycena albidolilacea]|uniref:ABC transporter domain-containing protein n=1 Tax=Mycena albidolilacea TaxID=1033008 RepID=A0AAD7ARI4_9AGAR|nr:hypothetical protein DFH08DRAFT_797159 [Mycena albidolilacea]